MKFSTISGWQVFVGPQQVSLYFGWVDSPNYGAKGWKWQELAIQETHQKNKGALAASSPSLMVIDGKK